MNPGMFNKKITFQKYNPDAKNENGFPLPEDQRYTDFKTVYAAIKTIKGSEYQQANATQNEVTSRFIIRYPSGKDIDSDMRIKFKGNRFYGIESIINDNEADVTLTIVAKELV